MPDELRRLLPGLRRGSTVLVSADAAGTHAGPGPADPHRSGSRALVLALLAAALSTGGWAAVVGMPTLGGLAALQAGVPLRRLALVPDPGPDWSSVVAALLDGMDLVVFAATTPVDASLGRRLAARARQRGAVLLPYGQWQGADFSIGTEDAVWEGLGTGHGRLRRRELTITVQGRGAATRPGRVRVWLPDEAGRLAAIPPATRPEFTVIQGGSAAASPAVTVAPSPATTQQDPGWKGEEHADAAGVVSRLVGHGRRDRAGGAGAQSGRGAARKPGGRLFAGGQAGRGDGRAS